MKKMLFAVGAFVSVFLFAGSVATAQYPAPTGSLTASTDSSNAEAGASVEVSCTVRDEAGNPVVEADCTFVILSQPGDDASLGSTVVKTNSDGVATTTLHVGSTSGQIVVSITSGDFTSSAVLGVTATLPASPISPPSTGDGGLAH